VNYKLSREKSKGAPSRRGFAELIGRRRVAVGEQMHRAGEVTEMFNGENDGTTILYRFATPVYGAE
jgi:hypothetical protein